MKRKKFWTLLGFLLLTVVLISACKGSDATPDASVPPALPEDVESLVLLAKFDLTIRTGIDIEAITTKSLKETMFDDSSLGVPEPGVEYTAVITPGYIIILEANGEIYEYHASGAKVVQIPK
ncbi:MAG: hypothetical protein E4H33_01830 [Anaerolineales bacterium]|nr:MAG: hypothetical protein E4H33_01830 [Anaerolineales bacterium]